ncbi:RNA ligase/cyclic nucleotide phosphodiesterase [Xylogone sp. PMI_703]|nr:RNA ligase/cyclic nucleotide phosphodiesterase [Xylogone sp. PMI_703]
MPPVHPDSVDTKIKFEDLSGVDITAYKNPYDALIAACQNDPAQIQARYSAHRTTRNEQQKQKLLSDSFSGLIIDPILRKLEDPTIEPGYVDPRNCLVFWGRPPQHIKSLVDIIQKKLLRHAPNLWIMPISRMHITTLEITHSLTAPEIATIVENLGTDAIAKMTDYTFDHRARLVKPMISYDASALALSFLPAAGEGLPSKERSKEDDNFTYHHLRQSLFNIASDAGVTIESRYVVPSSHVTIGRFLTQKDHDSPEKMKSWVELIEQVNAWLVEEYWPSDDKPGIEWIIGHEKGLDCRQGTLWYGGGTSIRLGKGF